MPDFHMITNMKTMFQGCFRAVSTGVCSYHQKSDFLSIIQAASPGYKTMVIKSVTGEGLT